MKLAFRWDQEKGRVTSGFARVALVIGCWTSVSTTVTPPRYPS